MDIKKYLINIKDHLNLDKTQEQDNSGEKKPINKIVIWIIIIAIIGLFLSHMLGEKKEPNNNDDLQSQSSQTASTDVEYTEQMETELKDILEKIQGAGEVYVRIYIDSTNEKVLAENSKKQSEVSESEKGKTESSSAENSTVTNSGSSLGGSGTPYVVQEKLPYPIGVVVVANGAKDERVKNEMYEVVKALYGLSANRIKITY